jgi:hypothetical protein
MTQRDSWWVRPILCPECGELIGINQPIADVVRANRPRGAAAGTLHEFLHARHMATEGGRWELDRTWATLREALEVYGP